MFLFLSNMAVLHHQSVLSVDVIDVTRGIPVHEHIIMYIVVKLFVLHGRNLKFDKSEHLNHQHLTSTYKLSTPQISLKNIEVYM